MRKIRVMIVEDSDVVRKLLEHIIGEDGRFEVAASLPNAEAALKCFHRVAPDVVSMDIRLPGLNGFDATRWIMRERPTPIVVVSASVEADDLKISMNALRAGALAVIEKPTGTNHADYQLMAQQICSQLYLMSDVKVVRQRTPRDLPLPKSVDNRPAKPLRFLPSGRIHMIGIVTSTGGPQALAELLAALPKDFHAPIVLVQHIVPTFLQGFVKWLDDLCPLDVSVAQDKEIPRPGRIYVAPAERHLHVEVSRLRVVQGPPVSFQCPSGTVLFQSMARSWGPQALGVLLTGMGEDGAAGLLEMRQAGAYTIGEDESTAVVYGMPGAAARMGAVCESLPLPEIAPRIIELATSAEEDA